MPPCPCCAWHGVRGSAVRPGVSAGRPQRGPGLHEPEAGAGRVSDVWVWAEACTRCCALPAWHQRSSARCQRPAPPHGNPTPAACSAAGLSVKPQPAVGDGPALAANTSSSNTAARVRAACPSPLRHAHSCPGADPVPTPACPTAPGCQHPLLLPFAPHCTMGRPPRVCRHCELPQLPCHYRFGVPHCGPVHHWGIRGPVAPPHAAALQRLQ